MITSSSPSRAPIRRTIVALVGAALALLVSPPARAVIFHATGDADHNTAPPGGGLADSGWQWVGNWIGFQAVPIGPKHFLAAKHIGGSVGNTFSLNGVTYATVASHPDSVTDLVIWEISGTFPAWAPLYRASDETGRDLVVFGRGPTRGTEVSVSGSTKGWRYGASDGRLRWGQNQVAATTWSPSWGHMLAATFDASGGPNEAHLGTGDSSAPVFINDGSGWKLAGVAAYVDAYFNTASSGAGFMAAIFDLRGLYMGQANGPWTLISGSSPVPSAFYATRVSKRLSWIDGILAQAPPATAPTISSHPAGQTVTAGANVAFSVTASGSPAPTFQWRKNGSNLSGQTASTLSLTNVQSGDAGSYDVVVSNSAGSVTSNAASLVVNPAAVAPTLSVQPSSQSATAGANVAFSATASGSPAPTYQWRKNGFNLSGQTASTLTLTNVQSGDAGSYDVVVSNSAGSVTSSAATLTVNVPPTISSHPSGQSVTAGANVSFSVTASGSPAPTYQWRKNGSNLSGQTASTLSLSNVQSGDAGSYTVVVSNAAGSVTSNAASLVVNPAPVAPTISTQPSSQTVTAGSGVSFSVTASGSPAPAYQWRKNGAPLSGQTASTLSLSNVQSGDAGSYSVVVSNSAGSVTSSTATLTVNVPPAISAHPASQSVTAGANATFSVTASGTPAPVYQWRKDGSGLSGQTSSTLSLTNVQPGDAGSYSVVVSNSAGSVTSSAAALTVNVPPVISGHPSSQTVEAGSSVSFSVLASGVPAPTYQWFKTGAPLSGQTAATLSLLGVTSGSSGAYTVVVSNAAGSVTSNVATLTVNAAPTISSHPASQTVTAGANMSFSVTASGTPTPTYQWRKDGADLAGQTSATLALTNVQATDDGSYSVVVSNASGSVTSNAASLAVHPAPAAPTLSSHPAGQTVTAGANVSFSVTASGTPAPTYQWRKDGALLPGQTGSTLSLSNVQTADAGSYSVVVSNTAGSVTSNAAALTVNPAQAAPTISSHPAGQTVTAGANVSFSVTASGSPAPTYQWRKDGALLPGQTGSTLSLSNVQAADAGAYSVVVSNASGSVSSNAASLAVNPTPAVPVFISQPSSQSVTAGSAVTFSVSVSGHPAPALQWFFNGSTLPGATGSALTLPAVQAADAGAYSVTATNASGTVSSSPAALSVGPAPAAPVILSPPAGLTATAGSLVSLLVTASGVPTPAYQWYKDGMLLPGSTGSAFTLTAVRMEDAAAYTVVVSNASGSVTSPPAVLTVTPAPVAPTISAPPAGRTVTSGEAVTFSVTASGTPALTYQWRKDGVPIPGATGPSFSLGTVQAADAGSFDVVVANSVGSVASASATLTVNPAPAAPVFTTHPASRTLVAGEGVTFSVATTGTPAPTLQWRRNGVDLPGATGPSFTLAAAQAGDAGSYSVVAANTAGSVTSLPATLTVLPATVAPLFTLHPASLSAPLGASVTLSAAASGAPFPVFQWFRDGAAITGATAPTLTLPALRLSDGGVYTVRATNTAGTVTSSPATLTVRRPSRLRNLSVRAQVSGGGQPLILGFVTRGSDEMPMLARAIGPFLEQFGVGGTLSDPRIQLTVENGPGSSNDDWGGSSQLAQAFARVGAFPLPAASKDSALLTAVGAGAFTLQASGHDARPGIALVEIYDASPAETQGLQLVNLSARNWVGSGDLAFITGLVIDGDTPLTLLLRGIGPALAVFGVPQTLTQPSLTLRSGDAVVASAAAWAGDPRLSAAFVQVGAFPLAPGAADSALVVTLAPGAYTLQLADLGGTAGNGLIEVYLLP